MNQVIAIDGPAASGKSSVARRVAAEVLGCPQMECYLDTGAMYRSVTWAALKYGVALDDAAELAKLAQRLEVGISYVTASDGATIQEVLIDGSPASEEIRTPEVDQAASVVAAYPAVRKVLVEQQRKWIADHQPAVVEGRDIGSVVAPGAVLKIFLTANEQERARRRQDQRAFPMSQAATATSTVADDLAKRDKHDTSRAESPLQEAPGAHVLDTSDLSLDQVVNEIKNLYADVMAKR